MSDLCRRRQCCPHAAILLGAVSYCLLHEALLEGFPGKDVLHMYGGPWLRKAVFRPVSVQQHLERGEVLPPFLQNRNYVHARACSERGQQSPHRTHPFCDTLVGIVDRSMTGGVRAKEDVVFGPSHLGLPCFATQSQSQQVRILRRPGPSR